MQSYSKQMTLLLYRGNNTIKIELDDGTRHLELNYNKASIWPRI
jgi:hypothetical protein